MEQADTPMSFDLTWRVCRMAVRQGYMLEEAGVEIRFVRPQLLW